MSTEYIQSREQRFIISEDPISQQRFAVVQATDRGMRSLSYFTGLFPHGSLTKGKVLTPENARSTDIDVVVVIDIDYIHENAQRLSETDEGIKRCLHTWAVINDYGRLARAISFKRNRWRRDNHFEEDDGDPLRLDLNARIVLAAKTVTLRMVMQNIQGQIVGLTDIFQKPKVDISSLMATREGDNSIMRLVQKLDGEEGSQDQLKINPRLVQMDIANYFGFDLDDCVRRYRVDFLNKLGLLDQSTRERKWSVVYEAIKWWERKGIIPDQIQDQFPRTFREAETKYN